MSLSIFFIITSILMIFYPLSTILLGSTGIISALSFASFPILIMAIDKNIKIKNKLIYAAIPISTIIAEIAYDVTTTGVKFYVKNNSPFIAIVLVFLLFLLSNKIKANKKDIFYFTVLLLLAVYFTNVNIGTVIVLYACLYFVNVLPKETYKDRVIPAIIISVVTILFFICIGTFTNGVVFNEKLTSLGFYNYIIGYSGAAITAMKKYAVKYIWHIVGFLLSSFIVAIPLKIESKKTEQILGIVPYITFALSMIIFILIQYH